MSKRFALLWGIIIPALSLSAGMARTEPLILGYSGTGVSGTLRRVIEKERLWQKPGLDVKAIYFNSGSVVSQAMVTGDIVVSDSDVPAQLSPKVAGIMDVRVIAVTMRKLLEAYVEAIYVFKSRPEVPLAALKNEGIEDLQVARGIYEGIAGSLREYPVPDPKGVQAALDSLATAKERKPEAKDLIDASLIEEIKKSGYVERLYGK